jgi:rhodanese-related sulfurtransferase
MGHHSLGFARWLDRIGRSVSAPTHPPAVRTIGRDELAEMIRRGDRFRLVMALNEWAFRAKHIPGSEHFNTPDELFSSLSPDDEIVVYCTSVDCHASIALYFALVDHGYPHVRRYSGGLSDWEAAGLPLEGEWTRRAGGDAGSVDEAAGRADQGPGTG